MWEIRRMGEIKETEKTGKRGIQRGNCGNVGYREETGEMWEIVRILE